MELSWALSKPLCSTDVNECADPSNCKNGHCVDTPGSYYCICSPPWTLATDRNSCVTPEEQAGECKHSAVGGFYEELQCSGGQQQFILGKSVGCLHLWGQYMWEKTDFCAKLNEEGAGICGYFCRCHRTKQRREQTSSSVGIGNLNRKALTSPSSNQTLCS